ncbi:TetR/AcrR family transcriptional regulator [Cellulomonas sp. zg-ZUI222]|uniref:TetR/AcrR family transcriptional regulator n=1 Tax=Cellulomonas wangleii TaxID=2816956 RepID=A0ABX8D2C1_9CELL|nr:MULTISPECIES: TetR family transcriptional regulator [Cellulomonas]MBO0920298.1 TetR/AcrR family transcriptional regulator [Cellulomonas wangleii]MBO0923270.1 TetR/AcrR family transcriptional regulator [Cellulomonas wangleii]MCM0640007.1 TetR/AcrR family transcriptional regulator [Cellulomonas wangsupingiae]QVI61629.1 TetR/AcrR family transcriptional regulator [Cellulomonas wangleii]
MANQAPPPVTGPRARTRQAILEAAIRALAVDPSASLGRVAELADVGRTTLHRYFPERDDLLAAVGVHAAACLTAAHARARLDDDTALDALLRVAQEYLELGDLLTVLFTGIVPEDSWAQDPTNDAALGALYARGLRDGSIDPRFDAEWALGVVWSVLYLAWSTVRTARADRHTAVTRLLLTLEKSLAPERPDLR